MAALGSTRQFPADDYEWAIGQAILERGRLQDEGHASVISTEHDLSTGSPVVMVTVIPGRPKGWSEAYGDDDADMSMLDRAHFGLDLRGA